MSTDASADEIEQLAAAVAAGERAAFSRLVTLVTPRLYRLAVRMTGGTLDAEDVLQEVFLKAHRVLTRGLFEARSRFQTWLYRVTVNASLDATRRRRRPPPETAPPSSMISPEAAVALAELHAALHALPEAQRVAIVLTQIEGLTVPEAARVLECSEGAIEQRIVRARMTLRRQSDA